MAARFIIGDGKLWRDFSAREEVTAAEILGAEPGLSPVVEVYSISLPDGGGTPTENTLTDADLDLAIGHDLPPDSGLWSVTFGVDSSSPVPLRGMAAASLSSALASLDAVQTAGGLDVESSGDGYLVTAKTFGAIVSSPAIVAENLSPPAVCEVDVMRVGDTDTYAQWLLRLTPSPAATIAGGDWSAVADSGYNGLTGTLSLATAGLAAGLARDVEAYDLSINHDSERLYRGFVAIQEAIDPDATGSLVISTPSLFTLGGTDVPAGSAIALSGLTYSGGTLTATGGGGGDLSAVDIDTLAELNAVVGDATLIDTGDSRLSDARTPTAHNHAASEITSGTLTDARVAESNVTQHEAAINIDESQINDIPANVDAGEIAAGTETAVRRYAPADIKSFVDTHAGGGGDLSAADIDSLAELNAVVLDATLVDTASAQTLTNKDLTASSNVFPTKLENIVNEALTASQLWSALGAGAGETTGSGLVVFGTDPAITGTNITGTAAGLTVGATTGVEAGADVTDTANVTSAGALMDSEVTNLAQVKSFDSSDYATAAQGTLADAAAPKAIYIEKHAASHTIDASECYGGVHYVTAAATITLPEAVDGMSVTIITVGAVAVSVDPNASDLIMLDGTALDDGDKITNLSTSGDIAVLTYYDATGWYAATNSWTDGGV